MPGETLSNKFDNTIDGIFETVETRLKNFESRVREARLIQLQEDLDELARRKDGQENTDGEQESTNA